MSERLTDQQLKARGLVLAEMVQQEATIAALRTRVAKLEDGITGYVEALEISRKAGFEAISERDFARARVAKLEAALKEARIEFEMWHEAKNILAKIDAALSETVEA